MFRFIAISVLYLISAVSVMPIGAAAQSQDTSTEEIIELAPEQLKSNERRARASDNRAPILVTKPAALLLAGFDWNFDYKIDQGEFVDGRSKAFARADSNRNGTLTPIELERWREQALGSSDAKPGNLEFDPNFDRAITRMEFEDTLERAFKDADENEDGVLAFSELMRSVSRRSRQSRQSRSDSDQRRRDRLNPRPNSRSGPRLGQR